MNKRKFLIIAVICIALIFVLCVACKNNSMNISQKGKEYYNETENSIEINTKTPITELKKKTINIGAFQSAEIIVNNNLESGDIDIEIFDIQNEELVGVVSGDNTKQIFFDISEGLGKYTINVDMQNYIGNCSIEWSIKEKKNFELFTSTMGYEFKYDPTKFNVIYESNSEKFVYNDNNEIYFKVYLISKEDAQSEKDLLYSAATQTGLYEISSSAKSGEYTLQNLKEKNMIKRNLIFEKSNDGLLILEICEPQNTEKIQIANEHIKNMIQTFVFK